MIRRPPRSTLDRSSAASDVYKRQDEATKASNVEVVYIKTLYGAGAGLNDGQVFGVITLSLIHISEPTRPY